MLHPDRADLLAGTAGSAVPDFVFGYYLTNKSPAIAPRVTLCYLVLTAKQRRGFFQPMDFQVLSHLLGRKRLATNIGRTAILTPTTAGAGIQIH
ncbi:hypothetical protein ES703_110023 [subsurface metagenome]